MAPVFGTRAITDVLIRGRLRPGPGHHRYRPTAAQVIERYVFRWSIEVAIDDARQFFGAGQARNRTTRVVKRTVPFLLVCQAIIACWFAAGGTTRQCGRTPGSRSLVRQ